MKLKAVGIAIALVIGLVGCAVVKDLVAPVSKVEHVDVFSVAQATINEVRVANVAAKKTIGDRVAAGMWSPEFGQKYLDETREVTKRLKVAQDALDLGDPTSIKKADAVKVIIDKLTARIAAEAMKESK